MQLKAQIQAALRQHLKEQLDADLREHLETLPGAGVYGWYYDNPAYARPNDGDRAHIQALLDEARIARAERDSDSVEAEADALMHRHGIASRLSHEVDLGPLQTNVQFF